MTSFALKIIALTAMVTDHVGDVFGYMIPQSFFLRCIGRIAFPLYAFMIAEGCRRTKNFKKYLTRLGVFALISEIPFDLCFENRRFWGIGELTFLSFEYQNVFFNLFLAALAIYLWEFLSRTKYKYAGLAVFPSAMIAAELFNVDYGYYAVPLIAAMYFIKNKNARMLAMTAGIAAIYQPYLGSLRLLFGYRVDAGIAMFLFAAVSVLLAYAYNGRRGPDVKYTFYAAYPLHLFILAMLNIVILI